MAKRILKTRKFNCIECNNVLEQVAWGDKKYTCPKCEGELIEIVSIIGEGPNIGKFESMTTQQKQEVLRKRSKDHHKKAHKKKRFYGLS